MGKDYNFWKDVQPQSGAVCFVIRKHGSLVGRRHGESWLVYSVEKNQTIYLNAEPDDIWAYTRTAP